MRATRIRLVYSKMSIYFKQISNEFIICISGLLLYIPNSNLTVGSVDFNLTEPQPHFEQTEVTIQGNPEAVPSPVGNAIRFTDGDRVSYKLAISEPWPCPLNFSKCLTGVTLSFWFRWEFIVGDNYRHYITMGNTFRVYRRPRITSTMISMRWKIDSEYSWWAGANVVPREWNLVTWMVNRTHNVVYLNGLKHKTRSIKSKVILGGINNELYFNRNLKVGNFSLGQMKLWYGQKSPVFIWRIYQEGLLQNDDNYVIMYWI